MAFYFHKNPIIFEVSGADAERYLNARLSNDIKLLTQEKAIEAAILTAQGKTQGFFTVVKLAESYLLYCTGGDTEAVIAAFKQFIVADRVEVVAREDLFLMTWIPFPGGTPYPVTAAKPLSVSVDDGIYSIESFRMAGNAIDTLGPLERKEAYLKEITTKNAVAALLSDEQYQLARIKSDCLSFPEELNETNLFAESELSHAVSFTKGCYVGQEAIEMLAARGKLPAKIVHVTVKNYSEDLSGQTLFLDEEKSKRIGKVLSSVHDEATGEQHALARLKTEHADESRFVFTESGTKAVSSPRIDPSQQK